MELEKIVEKFSWAFPDDFDLSGGERPDIDTQDVTERASVLMDANPSKTLFTIAVVTEMGSGHITPHQADQYLTMAEEQDTNL